ncbi:glycoside hydrolase family 43 protein [Gorillibacterium sp. CAU 1737]|uniref:glycoside hydrolase family 43 protein n=1 Tax=Gorillibacterium sp. CAU 1737 TaxID=3140362 RepID=UPI0032619642
MQYSNPVIPGFYPDPSICRVQDDYYLVTSTFEYFPGVPVFHSKDLVNWKQIGHCLTTESQLPLHKSWSSGGIYAPTIRYHDGWFYMTTTNVSGVGNFYVRTQDPAGPWSEIIPVDQGGIDPSLFFDEDGKVYYLSAWNGDRGDGIYQCELDISTGRRLTESRLVWQGTGGASPEAPHMYKRKGYYYLMIAEGGTEYGHMETIIRGSTPYGPFEPCPHNPILTHRSLRHTIHATGHADLLEAHDGTWWAVFLGIRPPSYPMRHHLGRETFLAPVQWTDEGWPVIGNNTRIEAVMDGPSFMGNPIPGPSVRDHFTEEALGFDWIFLRNPPAGSWSLTDKPSSLTLRGTACTLDEDGAPAFVGRRLRHFSCRAETILEFDPRQDGEEAGITVFMNGRYHYDFAVIQSAGDRKVLLRRTVGSLKTEQLFSCETGPVKLKVDATPDLFTFSFQGVGGTEHKAGAAETHLLSTEVAGGFTGVMLAMYAVSKADSASPAHFDWFDYEPLN